jgi:hypothetical protein
MGNGIDRVFQPEISPLLTDFTPSLSIFSSGLKCEKLPKRGFDGKSDSVFQKIIDDIGAAKRAVGTKPNYKIRQMPSDGANHSKGSAGVMSVAGAVDDGKKMSGLCDMGCEGKIGIGSSFDRIVALKCPAGAALCTDHRSIQINGDLMET